MSGSSRIKWLIVSGLLVSAGSFATRAWADADSAKKYLKDAQTAYDGGDAKSADDNLRLAEAELDGVADDAKAPIAADIKALRDKMQSAAGSAAKAAAVKYMDDQMATAKGALDAPQTFEETDQAIQDYLSKDENKAALGDEAVAKYLKTLSTYRKVERSKAAEANLAAAKDQLDSAEKDWPDKKKTLQAAEGDIDNHPDAMNFSHTLETVGKLVDNLPADNAATPGLKKRYASLQSDFNGVLYKSKSADTYRRIKDDWEGYGDEYNGWDKETDGPTFDYLLHHQGDNASKLNSPKTVGLITRSNYVLENWMKDDVIKTLSQTDDKVKGFVDKVRGDRKTAMEKLAKFASAVVDQADKATIDQDARDRLDQLANDDLPYAIAGSDQLKTLQDRAMKIVRAYDAKTGGDAAAHQKLYDDLVAAGAKAWPAMAAKVSSSEEFDANAVFKNVDNFKGKAFHFKGVNNRMGWDYSPGNGFQFAMTVDGTPVAAKYSSTVKDAVKAIEKRTAHETPDEGYDFIATVEDVGPIVKISRASGDIKTTGGETVGTITAQADETVPGVRLKIVALHAGAVTAAEDQGVVKPDGSVGPLEQ
jgi:hypothetical protein